MAADGELKFAWSKPEIEGVSPGKRYGHAMTAMGDKLFVFGGGLNPDEEITEYSNSMHVLQMGSALKWEEVSQKGDVPTSREGHILCTSGENLYLFGGSNQDGSVDAHELFCFDTGSGTWTRKTTTGDPPQSSSLRGVCVQGKLITFGGVIGAKAVNSVHALDLDSLVWEEVKTTGSPPMGRCDHAMVAVGDRLFIAAGSAGSDLWLNDTFVLSLVSWEWSKCEVGGTLPSPRDYPTLCNLEDQYLILFGGFNSSQGDDTAFADIHCLDIASGEGYSFTRVSVSGGPPTERYNHRATVYNKKVYVFGGMTLEEGLEDLWILAPEFEVVDFKATSGPQISYTLDTPIPMKRTTVHPAEASTEVNVSQLEQTRDDYQGQIGDIFADLMKRVKELEVAKRTLQLEREAFEAEKQQHAEVYEQQQEDLAKMLEQHRRETEEWITKERLQIDAQRKVIEERKVQLDHKAAELVKSQESFAAKSKKLDAIMKQVQGLAD